MPTFYQFKPTKRRTFHACLSLSYCCDMLHVTARLIDFILCSSSKSHGRKFGVSFKTIIVSGCSEYPQGCNYRHSEIQPESNRIVCFSEKSKRAVAL
jgi:hypothetical protein